MSRARRQRDTEWTFREQMRRSHEARERQARWDAKHQAIELVWVRHRLRFRCERCGLASTGPLIEATGILWDEEIVNWDSPANLLPCQVCGGWLCRHCGQYVVGRGWQCRLPCALTQVQSAPSS